MDYKNYFTDAIDKLKSSGNYRTFTPIVRKCGHFPKASLHLKDSNKAQVQVWCSNDYLAMGQNKKVIEIMQSALVEMGVGSGGTRNISGNSHYHELLELRLAKLHKKDKALIFTSGYVANFTCLATLGNKLPGCIFFSDEHNHNSLIEGMRHAKCIKKIWKHNDISHLEQLLAESPINSPKIIVFESVYSMGGDFGYIKEVIKLAKAYNAITFLDEVHAVGLYGETGAGVAERDGVMSEIDIIQGTLGKAFGLIGGYIAASSQICDFIRSFGQGFIFTTSLPPHIAKGAIASIDIVSESKKLRELHQVKTIKVKNQLANINVEFIDKGSHIVPVMIRNPQKCKKMADTLLFEHGIYVQPINYPTVPKGTERMRLTPSVYHSDSDIRYMISSMAKVFSEYKLNA